MNVDFKKEQINLSEMKMNEVSTVLVEGDVIVPDVKPDIKEILLAEANAVINNKDYNNGKLSLNGSIFLKILYAPDGGDEDAAKVKSINTKFDFKDEIACPDGKDLTMSTKVNTDRIEFSMVNSRKLNMKIAVSTQAKGYTNKDVAVAYDVEEDAPLEIKKDSINMYHVVADTQREIILTENLDVPNTKPDIDEILKVDVKATKGDCKVMNNKILLKGSLNIVTLYIGSDNVRDIEHMEHEIPFSEVLDIEGLSEDCLCNVTYDIKDVYFNVKDDLSGDPRVVALEVLISANVIASKTQEIETISDCYSPLGDTKVKKQKVVLDELINEGVSQMNMKEIISLNPNMPNVDAVYNVTCKPIILDRVMKNNNLIIIGKIVAFVLYVNSSDESPMYSYVQEIPFEHTVTVDDISENMMCECSANMASTSFSLNAASEIELRCNVEFYNKIIKPYELELISECSIDENQMADNSRPNLVIYFVQKGDTMWDIAKQYKTTSKKIMAVNKMEDNNHMNTGMKILIPKA